MFRYPRGTFARARGTEEVLAIHDSSYFQSAKKGPRQQVGIQSVVGARDFIAHVALLATVDGKPLGLGHLETLVRTGRKMRKPKTSQPEEKMTARWLRSAAAIDEQISATHVIDAEGDFWGLLHALQLAAKRFVIRARHLKAAQLAAELVTQACLDGNVGPGLVLHSDNGAPMRGSTMIATLQCSELCRPSVGLTSPTTTRTRRLSSER